MIGELMDMVRLVVGFLPWILFLMFGGLRPFRMEDASQGLHFAMGCRRVFRFLRNNTLWLQVGVARATHGGCCKWLPGRRGLVHIAVRQPVHTAICPGGSAPEAVA